MHRTLFTVLLIVWSLWFGGLISLFIFAQTLFARSRPTALSANPILFHVFERYQLGLAVLALAASIALALYLRSRSAWAVLILVAISTTCAIVSPALITRKMQALTAAGQSSTPAFKKLHGQSMLLYTTSAALLAAAAFLLPNLSTKHESRNTHPGMAANTQR